MAPSYRRFDDDLRDYLQTSGAEFSFFQAILLLKKLSLNSAPIGELGPVTDEAIRFKHDPRLIFQSSDISQILSHVYHEGRQRAEVTSTFLGLIGTSGPLSDVLTENVLAADAVGETALGAFYNIFHHRILSLFYRSWVKYRTELGFRTTGDGPIRRALAFVGIDPLAGIPKNSLPPNVQLSLAWILAQKTRSARTLKLILEQLMPKMPITVDSFVLRRAWLADDQKMLLGKAHSSLTGDSAIGRTVRDRMCRFRVTIGPVSFDAMRDFVPRGKHYARLRGCLEQFTPRVLEPEVVVLVAADEAPLFQLGQPRGGELGVTTRIGTRAHDLAVRILMSNTTQDARVSFNGAV